MKDEGRRMNKQLFILFLVCATGQNRLHKRAGSLANETRPLMQAVLTLINLKLKLP